MELYKKHRPKRLKDVLGCDGIKKQIQRCPDGSHLAHSILITGPSGCGKTTIARIVAQKILKTSDTDLMEINCADFRGIEMVRDIRSRMSLAPMGGQARTWIIDEAHQLTTQAQDAFLKILEDQPRHVYFILCTTDPSKLITTVKNRCPEWIVTKPKPAQLLEYLQAI